MEGSSQAQREISPPIFPHNNGNLKFFFFSFTPLGAGPGLPSPLHLIKHLSARNQRAARCMPELRSGRTSSVRPGSSRNLLTRSSSPAGSQRNGIVMGQLQQQPDPMSQQMSHRRTSPTNDVPLGCDSWHREARPLNGGAGRRQLSITGSEKRSARQRWLDQRYRLWTGDANNAEVGLLTAVFGINRSSPLRDRSHLIHPDSVFHTACVYISVGMCLYLAIVVQVEVAFLWDVDLCGEGLPTETWDIIVDLWFILEILLTFVTGVYADGCYYDDMRTVAVKYIGSGGFFFDLLTSVPETLIEIGLRSTHCVGDHMEGDEADRINLLKILQLMRPVRVIRVLRAIRVARLLKSNQHSAYATIFLDRLHIPIYVSRLFGAMMWILFIIHTGTCLFWFCKVTTNSKELVDDFLAYYDLDCSRMDPLQKLLHSYIVAWYYVNTIFTTVGFGDVLPENQIERIVSVFLMHIGVLVFGYLLSEVQDIASDALSAKRERSKLLTRIRRFLQEYDISNELSQRVTQWVEFSHQVQCRHNLQEEVMDSVPPLLQRMLLSRLHRGMLNSVLFLQQIPMAFRSQCLVDLFSRMKPAAYPKYTNIGDSRGSVADALLFITHGQCSVEFENNIVSTLRPGDHFGEHSLLIPHHWSTSHGVPVNFICLTFVETMVLTRLDFDRTAESFPEKVQRKVDEVRRETKEHQIRLKSALVSHAASTILNLSRWHVLSEKMHVLFVKHADFPGPSKFRKDAVLSPHDSLVTAAWRAHFILSGKYEIGEKDDEQEQNRACLRENSPLANDDALLSSCNSMGTADICTLLVGLTKDVKALRSELAELRGNTFEIELVNTEDSSVSGAQDQK